MITKSIDTNKYTSQQLQIKKKIKNKRAERNVKISTCENDKFSNFTIAKKKQKVNQMQQNTVLPMDKLISINGTS